MPSKPSYTTSGHTVGEIKTLTAQALQVEPEKLEAYVTIAFIHTGHQQHTLLLNSNMTPDVKSIQALLTLGWDIAGRSEPNEKNNGSHNIATSIRTASILDRIKRHLRRKNPKMGSNRMGFHNPDMDQNGNTANP